MYIYTYTYKYIFIHEMQQVTMATENLKKRFNQMLKLS